MPQTAVLDACVLFSASLRDTLLWAAKAGLYDLRLTNEILEETRRNLVAKRGLTETQGLHLVRTTQTYFTDHFVNGYEKYLALMPINKKDRHVLAAAVMSRAQVIVTDNLKDFPISLLAPYEVEAQSPDTFLLQLFADNPDEMKNLLIKQAANLRNPPLTVFEILDRLELEAPHFVRVVRELF